MSNMKIHYGPVIPLCDDVSSIKVFVFGDVYWPRPRDFAADWCDWALYWNTPVFLRKLGIGITQDVRKSIEREGCWRNQNRKFLGGIDLLCSVFLEADFVDRAVINVKQEMWAVDVMVSKQIDGIEVRLFVADYGFYDVASDDFFHKINRDIKFAEERIGLSERRCQKSL